jgi:hypothetical protein
VTVCKEQNIDSKIEAMLTEKDREIELLKKERDREVAELKRKLEVSKLSTYK